MSSIALCSSKWFAVDSRIKICSWIWKSGLRLGLEEGAILAIDSLALVDIIYCWESKAQKFTRAAASMDFVSSLISITELLNKSHCSFLGVDRASVFSASVSNLYISVAFTLNPFDGCFRVDT